MQESSILSDVPVLIFVLLSLVVIVPTIASAAFRFYMVLFMGMAVLVGGTETSALEISWIAIAGTASAASLLQILRNWQALPLRWHPAILTSLIWAGYVTFSLFTAASFGSDLLGGVRISVTAFTIPALMLVGIDAAWHINPKRLATYLMFVGVFTSLSYGVFWSSKRGNNFSTDALAAFALPSSAMAMLGVTMCLSWAIGRRRLWAGALVLALASAFFLITSGNRTIFLGLLGALFALVVRPAKSQQSSEKTNRLAVFIGIAALGVYLAFFLGPLARLLGVNEDSLTQRFTSFGTIFNWGVAADASGASRLQVYSDHWGAILANPLTGLGPGTPYATGQGVDVDSPLIIVVRYGTIGLILLVLFLWFYFRASLSSATAGSSIGHTWRRALWAWLVAEALMLPLDSQLEDKGLAIMMMIVAAGCLSSEFSASDRIERAEAQTVQSSSLNSTIRATSGSAPPDRLSGPASPLNSPGDD